MKPQFGICISSFYVLLLFSGILQCSCSTNCTCSLIQLKVSLHRINQNLLQHTGHGTADGLRHHRIQVTVPDPPENWEKLAPYWHIQTGSAHSARHPQQLCRSAGLEGRTTSRPSPARGYETYPGGSHHTIWEQIKLTRASKMKRNPTRPGKRVLADSSASPLPGCPCACLAPISRAPDLLEIGQYQGKTQAYGKIQKHL